MPTYEYKCSACGHAFEQFQSIMAEPTKRCPQCGKSKVKRLLGTGAGIIFKGSGFYITDYRDSSYAEKAKAESGAAGNASGGSEGGPAGRSDGGSEAKPAAEAKPAESKSSESKKSEPKPAASEKPAAPKSSGKSEKKSKK